MATSSEFFNELIRFEIELFNAVDRRLRADHGLAVTRFEPMQVIDRLGSCRVADVAEELVITVGGASKLVDRIEASGFCRRRPNPDDQRSSLIELTAAGRKILALATESFLDELDKRVVSVLPEADLQDLTTTFRELRRVGRSLDKVEPDPAKGQETGSDPSLSFAPRMDASGSPFRAKDQRRV